MKALFFILLLGNSLHTFGQYIIVEERSLFEVVAVGPFSLRTNHILLCRKADDKRSFNIYNLYYSTHNFATSAIDKKAFKLGYADYKKLANDVLVTITPLTDSLDAKLTLITADELKKLNIITFEHLLQKAVTNLYISFTKNELSNDLDINYAFSANTPINAIKNYQYKLILKKGNNYYRVNSRVLTEYYLVDEAGYSFPVQYHDGEINTATNRHTQYFSVKEINGLQGKFSQIDINGNALSNRVYPEKVDSIEHLYVTKYNTVPVMGAGTFYFLRGIGIVNGSYDYYFNDVAKANYDIDNFETGKNVLTLKTINGLTVTEFYQAWRKKYPPGIVEEL